MLLATKERQTWLALNFPILEPFTNASIQIVL